MLAIHEEKFLSSWVREDVVIKRRCLNPITSDVFETVVPWESVGDFCVVFGVCACGVAACYDRCAWQGFPFGF